MGDRVIRRQRLGFSLLEAVRNECMDHFPGLDGAFALLTPRFAAIDRPLATDGETLFFSPEQLIDLYSREPVRLRRGYMHMLLHCLFLHPFDRDRSDPMWELACDIAVELLLEREGIPRLALREDPVRSGCFAALEAVPPAAEAIEPLLRDGYLPFSHGELEAAFSFDGHELWGAAPAKEPRRRLWQAAGAGNIRRGGRPGLVSGDGEETLSLPGPGDRDYRRFLRRFTTVREEMMLDTDQFDPVFYHFGLEHYGDMPLIEPLEQKEVARLEELVIAIDTSGSCSSETVERFLSDTLAILSGQENFFRRMTVYLIQCDCMIQDVQLIRSEEDWKRCCRHVTVHGRGGTDFTPVFQYVETLRRQRKLRNLKALLYFTDGEGVYPRERPDYKTVFIFPRQSEYARYVPSWAELRLLGGRRVNKQERE